MQSPAASTALPLMARTLAWMSRSMPAMPMAERSAPIVVGMSVTSSATRTRTSCSAPEYTASGWRDRVTKRKMMVSPARRMLSATSLGVFCRSAPSTSEIIRSRNVSPA